ncbi:P-loop containing nucleoside triphosphate hydrolase protein [Schizophyllum commune]
MRLAVRRITMVCHCNRLVWLLARSRPTSYPIDERLPDIAGLIEPCFCPRRPSMARPQRTAPPPHVVAQVRAASQGGLKPPQKTGRRVTFAQAPSRAFARPPMALHLPLIFRLRADRCIALGESGAGHELGCTPGCGTCAPQKRRAAQMSQTDGLRRRKIAVMGSRSVGKSSLVGQFIDCRFESSYYPTIENSHQRNLVFNGLEYEVEVLDTAGQDEYSFLNPHHAVGHIHGYVLVYSINSRRSFEMVQTIHDKIADWGIADVPCVIAASKVDLRDGRQVDPAEGRSLASTHNAAWIETSAKENVNVGKVFELCLEEIEKRLSPYTEPKSSRYNCAIM